MIVFPNCKINLGLHIIGKREDGYHNIETVFYPLPWYDVLEVVQDQNKDGVCCQVFLSGLNLDTGPQENLCVKAYNALKKDFPQLPPVKIYLHKNIPPGSGLGGGSSDAAFMLQLLNQKFHLDVTDQKLCDYALTIGSDCPFFVLNKPAFARQRGEVLERLNFNLAGYKLILINPRIHVSTKWAFSQARPSPIHSDIREIIAQPLSEWKQSLINDFELPVFAAWPEIESIKKELYNAGAIYAGMSGSGSTMYGIFEAAHTPKINTFSGHYLIKEILL